MKEAKDLNNYISEKKLYELLKYNSYLKQKEFNFPKDLILYSENNFNDFNSLEKVCKTYESLKKESSLLDFDDLLILTYYNLSNNNNNFKKYSWIQVDEVQDLNPLQFAIIELLSDNYAHKVYFGDYEQSIFSFMGAKLERLHALEKDCKVHLLQKNFRSPSYLLNVYIDFAKKYLNPKWKKDPVPSENKIKQENDLLLIETKGDDIQEAKIIVNNILPKLIKETDKQTAILVRTNGQADKFSRLLSQKNIEHFKVSGYDLFRRQVIKDIMAFLGCLENELDRVSWFRMMKIFGKIDTLKNSRKIINSIFNLGFLPIDFLKDEYENNTYLSQFYNHFKNERIVIFDTETTGLDPQIDDIIQISAIEVIKGNIGKSFNVFIKTQKSLKISSKIHNISNDFLSKNGAEPNVALKKFNDLIDGAVLVAHNLAFDWNILDSYSKRNNIKLNLHSSIKFDSIEITRRIFPKLNSYSLESLIKELKLEGENTHNALDDVKATANLVVHLVNNFIESKLNQQNEFINKNKSVLKKFNKNLKPLWQYYQDNPEMETSFREMIDYFIEYSKRTVDYQIDEAEKEYFSKLLRHTDIKCGRDKLKHLISIHIPEYKSYKESDLVIGDEKIIISTIHKAKGMEFENVIIPSCVKDVYPNWNSKTEEEIKEDARTLYVALTRAKKRLIITTHSNYTSKYGTTYPREKSCFLKAIEKHFEKSTF